MSTSKKTWQEKKNEVVAQLDMLDQMKDTFFDDVRNVLDNCVVVAEEALRDGEITKEVYDQFMLRITMISQESIILEEQEKYEAKKLADLINKGRKGPN